MKSILITGSTDGIGKLAAIKLAQQGNHIYIHGRNKAKVESTIAAIKAETGNNQIEGFVADFANLNEVNSMAMEIKSQLQHLDVLVNNAGVFKGDEPNSTDGFDLRYKVNYLAPYVLTNELIPLLEKGASPRIINLSSAAQSEVSYSTLMGKIKASANASYAQSKLALTMWSFHMAKEHKSISVLALNPGSLLNTKMVMQAYGQHWAPAEKGAKIIAELAIDERYNGITGAYFDNDLGGFARAHSRAYDPTAINDLIRFTKELIN